MIGQRVEQVIALTVRIEIQARNRPLNGRHCLGRRAQRVFVGSQFNHVLQAILPLHLLNGRARNICLGGQDHAAV